MDAIDTTVNLGHVLNFIGIIGAAIAGFFAVKGRLIRIETSNEFQNRLIEGMQIEIKELRKVVEAQTRFDERLVALQREVTELRHGKGFIANNHAP